MRVHLWSSLESPFHDAVKVLHCVVIFLPAVEAFKTEEVDLCLRPCLQVAQLFHGDVVFSIVVREKLINKPELVVYSDEERL